MCNLFSMNTIFYFCPNIVLCAGTMYEAVVLLHPQSYLLALTLYCWETILSVYFDKVRFYKQDRVCPVDNRPFSKKNFVHKKNTHNNKHLNM